MHATVVVAIVVHCPACVANVRISWQAQFVGFAAVQRLIEKESQGQDPTEHQQVDLTGTEKAARAKAIKSTGHLMS